MLWDIKVNHFKKYNIQQNVNNNLIKHNLKFLVILIKINLRKDIKIYFKINFNINKHN